MSLPSRSWGALLVAAVSTAALAPTVAARPVRVGRFAEIPYGVSPRHPWPTGHGDERRTARSRFAIPEDPPVRTWQARAGVGRVFGPAVTEDGSLFVASQAGLSLVSSEGTVRWSMRLGLASGTPSLTPDGRAAVGVQPGRILVVGHGSVFHRANVGGGVRGSPLVLGDGSLVVAAYDQALHRYDSEGHRIFRTPLPGNVRGMAARTRDRLVVPSGDEVLFVTLDGRIAERGSVGGEIGLGPAVADDGSVWVTTTDSALVLVEPNGSIAVRRDIDVRPSMASNLAIAPDGSLRLATADAGLLALSPRGSERWRYETNGPIIGGIVVDRTGQTLCITVAGQLLAVDSEGQKMWDVPTEARTDAAPTLTEGAIYVATFGGTVQAWRIGSPQSADANPSATRAIAEP